jgi:hypothetical protein
MVESIHLLGADDVRSAGYAMRDAAGEMKRAAESVDFTADQHRRRVEEWLARFEALVERMEKALEPKP